MKSIGPLEAPPPLPQNLPFRGGMTQVGYNYLNFLAIASCSNYVVTNLYQKKERYALHILNNNNSSLR